jgi:putative adenylate-forming enzyme
VSRFDIVAAYIGARWRAATLHGERLRRWQHVRLGQLIDDVRTRSPFYHDLWGALPASRWSEFPTVDKHAMMRNFDRFNTIGVAHAEAMSIALDAEQRRDFSAAVRGCTVGLSSGTSGHRGLFLVSPDEQTRWAGTILSRAISDLRPGHRVAFFLRANSRLYERTSSVVKFRFFDLMQPLDDVVARLNEFRPQLIVGPPSLLGLLADAREQGRLRVTPSRVISVAEVLEPQDRDRLERIFQCRVGEVYQCTEGLIAVTCAHGALHVQEDVMVLQVEPIDDGDATRVAPILTDLWRRVQPIVRYRLGDVLRLDATPCSCGSSWQRIASIEGRQDDLCWFPASDDVLRVVFPDAIRRMMLLADDRITEYHVEQVAAGELNAFISVRNRTEFADVARRLRTTVTDALASYGCRAIALTIHDGVPAMPPGAKRRRVVCTWKSSRATSFAST